MAVISYAYNDKTQLSKHFNVQEFRCKCGKTHDILISQELVYQLERLFDTLDCSKIIVSSGHRCSEYDKKIGNSGVGQHILGKAADVYCYDKNNKAISTKIVSCVAQDLGFGGIANINSAYTWIHLDVRTSNIYMGNEIINYHTLTDDFYKYYGLTKEEVYGEKYKPSTTTEITKGEIIMSTQLKGVDLSKHNGTVDFATLKNNVDFVIIRAGYGKLASQKDVKFEEYYAGCKKYGIPVGTYWYSYAKSVAEVKQEAQVFLNTIKGKQFEYPLYFDLEEKSAFNTGKANCSAMVRAFCGALEDAGYYAGLYMSRSPFNTYIESDIKDRYSNWLAEYNSKLNYSGNYDMWQYTDNGRVGGVNGHVDMNYCYKDLATVIKNAGLNGFPKTSSETSVPEPASQPTPKKSNEEIAKEVLAGKWGNGDERKRRLTEAGYNYADVQKAVNALLNQNDNTTIEPVAQKTDEKKQIKVTIDFDDHQYSGLLEEM
jgi:GH25 family lysozyme M1 (1,4-beta-N-acetylmuramidase)